MLWGEICRREPVKFGVNLDDIFNVDGLSILSIYVNLHESHVILSLQLDI